MRLHHVSLLVADLARSLHFYCEVLQLPLDATRPALNFDGAWLSLPGGQQIHLLCLDNPDPVTGRPEHGGRDRHTAFLVDDLAAVRARLDAHGIDYTLSKSGRAALFCRDPDGHACELIQTQ